MPVTSTGIDPAAAGSKRSLAQTWLPIRFRPTNRIAVNVVQRSSSVVLPCEYSTGLLEPPSRFFQTSQPNPPWAATKTMPMSTYVRANWWSIHGAAAETPCGNHQVWATKKYVLKKVISQMMTRRARPIYEISRVRNLPTSIVRKNREGYHRLEK